MEKVITDEEGMLSLLLYLIYTNNKFYDHFEEIYIFQVHAADADANVIVKLWMITASYNFGLSVVLTLRLALKFNLSRYNWTLKTAFVGVTNIIRRCCSTLLEIPQVTKTPES